MNALLPTASAAAIELQPAARVDAVADAGIVSRSVLQTPDLRITLFTFAAGQELTTHTNRRRAIVHVLEGSCEFLFEGRWQTLAAGTLLHLPPSHPHAVRATQRSFSMLLTLGPEPTS